MGAAGDSGRAGITGEEIAAAFTVSSQRVTRAFLLAQIAEAWHRGVGDTLWVTQMIQSVSRLDDALSEGTTAPADLRLVE